MKFRFILYIILSCLFLSASADNLTTAKQLYSEGKYSEALPLFMEQYKKNPKNGSINHWIGVCLYYEERYSESEKYFKYAETRKVNDATYFLALANYKQFKYSDANDYVDEYTELMAKSKKTIPNAFQANMQTITQASIMLDHVENIAIIDSLIVPKDKFFKYFKISPESFSLNDVEVLPAMEEECIAPVFMPESQSRMLWSAKDTTGYYNIYQTTKLFDGSWDAPRVLDENLVEEDGDMICPYIKSDGTSLYFASNSDSSIGGYDIFTSSKNLDDGSFYKPQNLGMPYNSPYDDYMFCIDEYTNVGWWATDRNLIPDSLTIYIFVPSDIRSNYSVENPNIEALSHVNSIKDTWPEGADYSSLIDEVRNISMERVVVKKDFEFFVNNNTVYTSLDNFKNKECRAMAQKWQSQVKKLNSVELKLADLRQQYAKKASTTLGDTILKLEAEQISLSEDIQQISNNIRKILNKK